MNKVFYKLNCNKNHKYEIVEKEIVPEILVSVCLITYNQEKYIIQALDSITKQKTNFKYEVIIGNDNSPDNTKKLLDKYVNDNKMCDIIILNRKQNLGPTKNFHDILKKCKGKYVAFLEGDDYWIDDNKLEKQVQFLENNKKYVGVAHDNLIIDENDKYISKRSIQMCWYKKYTNYKQIEKGKLMFHINSLMVKNIFNIKEIDSSIIYRMDDFIADNILPLVASDFGDIYLMRDVMSVYRFFDRLPNKKTNVYLEHVLLSLDISKKLENEKFYNYKLNSSFRKAYSFVGLFLWKVRSKEKIPYKFKIKVKSYLNLEVYLKIPICFVNTIIKYVYTKLIMKIKNI